MKKQTILIILLCLLVSCQINETKVIKEVEFKTTISLKASEIETKEILSIDNFVVKDSFVIVSNIRKDSLFLVYGLPDFKCLKAFGKKGRGPNEFSMPKLIDNPSSKEIFVADFALQKLSKTRLNTSEINIQTFNYSGDLPQSIFYAADSFFIFDTNQQEVKLHKMNKDGSSKVIHDFKNLKERYPHSNAYWGFLGVNDSLKRIVYAYQYLRRFDIFDFDGNEIKRIEIRPNSEPKFQNNRIDQNNSVNYFFGIRSTDRSIFLYYIGHTGKKLAEDLNVTTYIEEYDWNGKPLKRYRLNKFIWGFDLLPNQYSATNKFIGLDKSKPNPFTLFVADSIN